MPGKDIIVIGASVGGIEAVRAILANVPAGFGGSIFVVVHTSANAPAVLDFLFSNGPLAAITAKNNERIAPGRIYVAPSDHHLIIEPGRVCVSRGPRENRFRPAIDPLFRSAAQTYGPRVVGIILSGGLDDGSAGLWTVKQLGGTAIVQDPAEALAPSMPMNAIRNVRVDYVVKLEEIAPLIVRLASTPADAKEVPVPEHVKIEVDIAKEQEAKEAGVFKLGESSNYACPECHGVLLEMDGAIPRRFRCHTGHAYTFESLVSEMDEKIEDSLSIALRALDERVMILRDAAKQANGESDRANALLKQAGETQERADWVRKAALNKR